MDRLSRIASVDAVFDELKRRLDDLVCHPEHDNEATRHDRLIVPILTHPLIFGWDCKDLVAQASITVPSELLESHIFRDARPRTRKPDILVVSSAFQFNALVVEEKKRQQSAEELDRNRFQLHEYQSLYECIWGLLTDGERWILKKGFESFHTFESLDELRAGLNDIQYCIGKESLLRRKLAFGTCDVVIVVPSMGFGGAGAFNTYGMLLANMGRRGQAEEMFKRLVDSASAQGNDELTSAGYCNWGVMAYYRGSHEEAGEYYQKALQISEPIGHHHLMGNQYANLGVLAHSRGETKVARKWWFKARRVFKASGDTDRLERIESELRSSLSGTWLPSGEAALMRITRKIGLAVQEAGWSQNKIITESEVAAIITAAAKGTSLEYADGHPDQDRWAQNKELTASEIAAIIREME